MSLRGDLTWTGGERGGIAELVSLTATAMVVRSEVPHPPGARVEGTTVTGEIVRMKVHGGRREADGVYRIEGRPVDMKKELREKLAASIASG